MSASKLRLCASIFSICCTSAAALATSPWNYGDFSNDGKVAGNDVAIIDSNYNHVPAIYPATGPQGDANGDTLINGRDYAILNANIGYDNGTAPTNVYAPGSKRITNTIISMEQSTDGVTYVPSSLTPTLNPGDFYRFGIAAQVTDTATGLPSAMGLANIGYTIASSDAAGSFLAPVPFGARNPYAAMSKQTIPISLTGVLLSGNIAGGQIGVGGAGGLNDPIFFNDLGYDRSHTAFTTTSDPVFIRLTFRALQAGTVKLSPTMDLASTDLLANVGADDFGQPCLGIVDNPEIDVNITPEPASMALLGLPALLAMRRNRNRR